MSRFEVPLGAIRNAFQGVIPSPIATASASGEPHTTYLSVVRYVDEERIALTNQFMGTTTANMHENPNVVIRVIDPTEMTEYEIIATHVLSATSGPVFDGIRAQLEGVAAQSGMDHIFRLKSAEILRVTSCHPAGGTHVDATPSTSPLDLLSGLDVFGRRLAASRDLEEVTRVALESIEDLFGFRHSILLLADPVDKSLFVVGSNGYGSDGAGAEVPFGKGMIGVAAQRRRQVLDANVVRSRTMVAASHDETAQEIPLPGLSGAQSVLATPLVVQDRLVGVLYLDSPDPGRFGPESARLVEVMAGNLAVSIALLDDSRDDAPASSSQTVPPAPPLPVKGNCQVVFHDHDGSVFVDGDYVIKGVAGRVLFLMLREHQASGRTEFTNREIRLDRAAGLPFGKDNLEARLLTLRRRLEGRSGPFRLEKAGRGRLRLLIDAGITLEAR